jgi:methyl coenzyme M reductase subunit C
MVKGVGCGRVQRNEVLERESTDRVVNALESDSVTTTMPVVEIAFSLVARTVKRNTR